MKGEGVGGGGGLVLKIDGGGIWEGDLFNLVTTTVSDLHKKTIVYLRYFSDNMTL